MSGTQVTLLWIYAGIIAIWPIRLIVLGVILRRMEVLDSAVAPVCSARSALGFGDSAGQG